MNRFRLNSSLYFCVTETLAIIEPRAARRVVNILCGYRSKGQSLNQEKLMLRLIVPTLTLLLVTPFCAQAASKQEFELSKMLEQVAKESSVGTPRAINEDILDQGYTVEGNQLINHLSVQAGQAQQMRADPDSVRNQLGNSVCHNNGYRQLMTKGAVLKYQFTEYKTNRPVAVQVFKAGDCSVKKK
jgi:hypothetical protein